MSQTAFFEIACKGRDANMREVLERPVRIIVKTSLSGASIETDVTCKHNTGGHGHRCKASHPDVDKIGEGIPCPYAVSLPYAIDQRFAHEPEPIPGMPSPEQRRRNSLEGCGNPAL